MTIEVHVRDAAEIKAEAFAELLRVYGGRRLCSTDKGIYVQFDGATADGDAEAFVRSIQRTYRLRCSIDRPE